MAPFGVKQARMVRDVLVQAKSAFAFQPPELLRFAELLDVITLRVKLRENTPPPVR